LQFLVQVWIGCLTLASIGFSSAMAQDAETQQATTVEASAPAGLFVDTLDVSVVNVEVFVTDKDGERVTDLRREDFQIFEDKKEMELTNFYLVEGRGRRRGALEVPLAEETPRAAPPSFDALPDEQRLHLVVYIDNSNIHPFHRNNVFTYVRTFLTGSLVPGDLVSIYTFEQTLHLRQAFTDDRSRLNDTLREIENLSAHGVTKSDTRRGLLRDIDRARSRAAIEPRIRMHAEQTANAMEFTIESMKQIVDSLAGLPGRKAILHVSDGLPMRPAEDLYQAIAEKFDDPSAITESTFWDQSRRFGELTARANANRVTFYTIEAAGLRSSSSGMADTSSARSFISVDRAKRLNYQSPLLSMADETGGIAIVGTSNFRGGFDRVAQDFDTYYSLGYVAGHGGDGRYHEIDVRVAGRKDLKVRFREGYRAKTPAVWMSERTTAMLNYDLDSNPLGLAMELGQPTPAQDGRYAVPIVVSIPIRNVTLIPQAEFHLGRMKLFVSATDDRGRVAEVGDQPWAIEIPDVRYEEAQSMRFSHEVNLLMRPGLQRVAVGVRDEIGAVSSFVRTEIEVGRRSTGR